MNPSAVVRAALTDPDLDLTPNARAALAVLGHYVGDRDVAYPSVGTLAGAMGVSVRHARRALSELATARVIVTVGGRRGGRQSTSWALDPGHRRPPTPDTGVRPTPDTRVRGSGPTPDTGVRPPRTGVSAECLVERELTLIGDNRTGRPAPPAAPMAPEARRAALDGLAAVRDTLGRSATGS